MYTHAILGALKTITQRHDHSLSWKMTHIEGIDVYESEYICLCVKGKHKANKD